MAKRMNGHDATPSAARVQIDPAAIARAGLVFLERVQFVKAERATFDQLEALLAAIAGGAVQMTQAQAAPIAAPGPNDSAPPPS